MNAPALWTAFFGSGSGISHLFGLATDTGAWSVRNLRPLDTGVKWRLARQPMP